MENNNNKSYSKPEPRPPLQSQSKCAKIGRHPLRYCHSPGCHIQDSPQTICVQNPSEVSK